MPVSRRGRSAWHHRVTRRPKFRALGQRAGHLRAQRRVAEDVDVQAAARGHRDKAASAFTREAGDERAVDFPIMSRVHVKLRQREPLGRPAERHRDAAGRVLATPRAIDHLIADNRGSGKRWMELG